MNWTRNMGMLFLTLTYTGVFSQKLDVDLQLRPRFEYRNGFKTILKDTEREAAFVSQRSRLNIRFESDKIQLKVALQNVRVWGDVPTNTSADKNGIAFFEAYGLYSFTAYWDIKVGRQVLSYDNQRIFGEVDWTQQAQSHDAAVITYKKNHNRLDIGGALNADAEDLVEKKYETKNYKSMQFAWFNTQQGNFSISGLILNTAYEYFTTATDFKVDYLQTMGTYSRFQGKNTDVDIAVYTQLGKREGANVQAWNFGANANHQIDEHWKMGVGYEFLSGTAANDNRDKRKSFTPLFGTNHAFNGYMDYFYVGNHLNSVGLSDLNAKLNFKTNHFQLNLIPHVFFSAETVVNAIGENMDKYLGTEIDLVGSYQLHKEVTLGFGYAQLFASPTLKTLKDGNATTNNWAWVSINFDPSIFSFSK